MDTGDIFVFLDKILIDSDRYRAYMYLTQAYMDNNDIFRSIVSELWDFGVPWVFPNIRQLASTKDEIFSPTQKIQASLIYYSINSLSSIDIREDILGIAIIYHSCIEAGLDPDIIFRSVAQISPPNIHDFFLDFLERPNDLKSMKAFCLIKSIDDGIIEIRVKPPAVLVQEL